MTPPKDATPMPNTLMQTSPAVGISFCLIIVRLGATNPEAREDSWECSQRSQTSRVLPFSGPQLSRLPVPLDRVKVERDVYVSESESGVVEFRVTSPTSSDDKQSPIH
jgi:hypothetical protein